MPTKTANWRYPRAERISGTQLDIVALVAAANVTRGQAAAAVRGEISGKQTEAAYHAAIKTSNDLWEWYAAMRTESFPVSTWERYAWDVMSLSATNTARNIAGNGSARIANKTPAIWKQKTAMPEVIFKVQRLGG